MPDPDIAVTRAGDGTILVATGQNVPGAPEGTGGLGPAFARSVLDVAGAILTWPVLRAPGLPMAEVHDAGSAQQWLWAVYGERTAAAVQACAEGGADRAGVAAEGTALADRAARLALGHWAARWWPTSYLDGISGLEPDLLGLELAALTHECQQLFGTPYDTAPDAAYDIPYGASHHAAYGTSYGTSGDQPDDCVAELVEDHQAGLAPLIQWWRSAPEPPGTSYPLRRHVERVLRLIDEAADNAGLDGPALRHLRISLGQDRPDAAPADLGALFARTGDYALAAAGEPLVTGGRVIGRGSGANEWHRYPPGFVDAAEHAVSWTARAVGARREIEVEVVTDAAAPDSGVPLVAEVRVDGGPAERVPLSRRGDLWTGRAHLELMASTVTPRIEVGVLLPGFDPGPGDAGDAAYREAIRSLARRRLSDAAAEPVPRDTFPGPFLAEIVAATTAQDF
ncbi:hypothetical protein [Streptomyces sp. NPDC001787]|uniref:hypothetical protein n=1 Tax=Streptomyces sp. NPDC001787 TaxID=3154523 RepID=UPI003328C031